MQNMAAGRKVDRIGVAGWYHMPLIDRNLTDFSKGVVDSARVMHWDFCKIQNHNQFLNESLGLEFVPSYTADKVVGPIRRYPIYHPRMFRQLKTQGIGYPSIAMQIEATKRILDELKGEIPVIATVFSPAYIAREICGDHIDYFKNFVKYDPEDVQIGLRILSELSFEYLNALLDLGIDGIMYCDKLASYDDMSYDDYQSFSVPYDLPLLELTRGRTWFNILHVHGYKNLRFDQYERNHYNVQAYNWEDRFEDGVHKPITLKDVRSMTDKILIGGVEFWHDFDSASNNRDEVKERIVMRLKDALSQMEGEQRFVFAPGCSVKPHVPPYRMELLYEAVREVTGVD